MSSTVNIPKSNNDPMYRYKRQQLITTTTNKSIILSNIKHIADDINRDIEELVQHIKVDISRPVKITKNKEVVIPNFNKTEIGKNLDDVIETFICKFVICPACQNPETSYVINKKIVNRKCASCGSISSVEQTKYVSRLAKNERSP
jgi:translation initiation factor 5